MLNFIHCVLDVFGMRKRGAGYFCATSLAFAMSVGSSYAEEISPLLLDERTFLDLVAMENDQLRHHRMEVQISEQAINSAWSVFEPALNASIYEEYGLEQNDTLDAAQRSASSEYEFKNDVISVSLDGVLPTGTEYKVYLDQEDPSNSLQTSTAFGEEYKTTVGLEITQPLLKNFGMETNLASVYVAEKDLLISEQNFIKTKMGKVYQGAVSFTDLLISQMRFKAEQDLLEVERERNEIVKVLASQGRVPATAMFEAESELALREARNSFTRKLLRQNSSIVRRFLVGTSKQRIGPVIGADSMGGIDFDSLFEEAEIYVKNFDRPEYRAAVLETDRERIRANYAENQQLIDLDLKVGMGKTGLSDNHRNSMQEAGSAYKFWNWGLYVSVPLFGGYQADSASKTASLKYHQALLTQSSLATTIEDEIYTAEGGFEDAVNEAKRTQNALDKSSNALDLIRAKAVEGIIPRFELLRYESNYILLESNYKEKIFEVKKAHLGVLLASGGILSAYNLSDENK